MLKRTEHLPLVVFPPRETLFVTPSHQTAFEKGVYCKRKEFAPLLWESKQEVTKVISYVKDSKKN